MKVIEVKKADAPLVFGKMYRVTSGGHAGKEGVLIRATPDSDGDVKVCFEDDWYYIQADRLELLPETPEQSVETVTVELTADEVKTLYVTIGITSSRDRYEAAERRGLGAAAGELGYKLYEEFQELVEGGM